MFNDVDWKSLDQVGQPTRIRLSSTVAGVMHDGSPNPAESVSVIYNRDGKLHKVRAKHVVMACGHSELTGAQLWTTAAEEGARAASQILDMS